MSARFVLSAFAVACCATPALAHAFLQHAEPGAGATVKTPPGRIALTFSDQLEPLFTAIAITDSAGRSVEAGAAVIRGKSVVAPLRRLAPGTYRVVWHADSVDAHRTQGAYNFTVGR